MMLKLELLPATCGDCLWLEYGSPPRVIVIDGGLRETAKVLGARINAARHERGTDVLELELLVVTHIDNDHILGIIELLKSQPPMRVKDVWFNGRPQLMRLPTPTTRGGTAEQRGAAARPT
jgi:glyoxylase-like metal-dependent hydrolase (beta-lactamase superfamily II)